MIIFLYGEDTFRSRKKLQELKEKFIREVDPHGTSLSLLDGEKTNMQKINDAIGSASLLSKKRMVVIENLFNQKEGLVFEQILNFFKNKAASLDDNIIIVWDSLSSTVKALAKNKAQLLKFLAAQKYAQEFKSLSNPETAAWVKKEIESRSAEISREALARLVVLTGSDLWQLNNEINKLINYKQAAQLQLSAGGESARIETQDVVDLVEGVFDQNIFVLMDAISNRNKNLVVKLFEEQLEAGKGEDYLLNMITRQIKILLQVRQALDSGLDSRKIISQLKLHPFVVQKSITQVRNFNLVSLKNLLTQLIKLDAQMKTGQINLRAALDLFFVKL